MNLALVSNYGELNTQQEYRIIDEGDDWFQISSGHYIPKSFCKATYAPAIINRVDAPRNTVLNRGQNDYQKYKSNQERVSPSPGARHPLRTGG